MPNCDFFALGTDHELVLNFVFAQRDCRVYQLNSDGEEPAREFPTLNDLAKHYSIADWASPARRALHLQLYPTNAGGDVLFKRIDFRHPVNGARFRYDVYGWGLIQLFLESPHKGWLRDSHTNHNSEKRALLWERQCPDHGPVAAWRWNAVASLSRRLNRFIHKIAVRKVDTRCVLPEAAKAEAQGLSLRPPQLQGALRNA